MKIICHAEKMKPQGLKKSYFSKKSTWNQRDWLQSLTTIQKFIGEKLFEI